MRYILSILLLFCSLCSRADRYECSYYLKGNIKTAEGVVVANTQFTLKLGHNTRTFYTDAKGNYFVEVIYSVLSPCRYMDDGTPLGDELGDSREYNTDSMIISSNKGASCVKSNWESYYSRKEKHYCFDKYEGLDLVEQMDVTLNKPPVLIKMELNPYREELKKKLSALNKIPIDSFKESAKIKIDTLRHSYILPNGALHDMSDNSFTETILWECYISSINTSLYLDLTFSNIEFRNQHIDSLSSDEILGSYPTLFELKKKSRNEYIVAINRFKDSSSYYTFYTNNSGYITDVIHTDSRN